MLRESAAAGKNSTNQIPNWWDRFHLILASQLSGKHKLAMLVIAGFAGDSNECYASRSTLAKSLSVEPATVNRTTRELADAGFLDRVRRQNQPSILVVCWDRFGWTPQLAKSATVENESSHFTQPELAILQVDTSYLNTKKTPPPPSPSPVTDPPHNRWGEVGEALRKAGVQTWRDTLTTLRDQPGMTPDRALAFCRHFAANHERLSIGPGKLVHRLQNDSPEWEVNEHWGQSIATAPQVDSAAIGAAKQSLMEMPAEELQSLIATALSPALIQVSEGYRSPLESVDVLNALVRDLVKREASQ